MLKKLIFIAFLIGCFVFGFKPQTIFASSEQIDEYLVEIKLEKSSQIEVLEKIKYDFSTNQKHGIFRKIPRITKNSEGKKYVLDITVKTVLLENNDVPYTISNEGEDLVIKIGDPDKTITGIKNYSILYRVDGAVNYFSDHDELYWNSVGTSWDVPILKSSAKVDLSSLNELNAQNLALICYTGPLGGVEQNCTTKLDKNKMVLITAGSVLNPREGLTFAVSFPKDIVVYNPPKVYEEPQTSIWWVLFIILMIALNFIGAVLVVLHWITKGRDVKDDRVIVRMYDAPKGSDGKELTPLELGAVIDEDISFKDISAEIVHLAIQKYIVIKEDSNKKITIFRGAKLIQDPSMSSLKPHQKELVEVFGLQHEDSITLDDNPSADKASKILKLKSNLYEELTKKGYFDKNPLKITQRYLIFGFLLAFTFFFIPGLLMIIFARFMPKKTRYGVDAQRHGLGLKIFLKSQDRQFEFQEKNFYFFEKLLPYAISFNVAKVWAKKFEDLYNYRPDWYQAKDFNNFNTLMLINSLDRNFSAVQNSIATPTSSTTGHSSGFSGGSSGGGGGGGGGGSW